MSLSRHSLSRPRPTQGLLPCPLPHERGERARQDRDIVHYLQQPELHAFALYRSLGRPRNAVMSPSGWYCTSSSIPATVSQLPGGRVRLDYRNGRPEPVAVLLEARRRAAPTTDGRGDVPPLSVA